MSTQAQRAKAQPTVSPTALPTYPRKVIEVEPEAEAKATSQVGSNNGLYPLCRPGAANPAPGAHMRIERSLSPDGRINSVSVVIDYPIGNEPAGEIKAKAQKALLLQAEIIREHFAACELRPTLVGTAVDNSGATGSHGVSATLLDIGAISSRRGTRYFINAEVGGEQARLYGSRRQLITQLARVGLDLTPDAIAEGLRLNFACQAVTKPGQQGDHLNVVRIYPAG